MNACPIIVFRNSKTHTAATFRSIAVFAATKSNFGKDSRCSVGGSIFFLYAVSRASRKYLNHRKISWRMARRQLNHGEVEVSMGLALNGNYRRKPGFSD
jgi:hypothetical protein